MSVDGFSMSALGLPKDITSAQAAASVEQGVLSSGEKTVEKIDRAVNKRINNDEKEEKNKNNFFQDGYAEEDADEENEEKDEEKDEEGSLNKDAKISSKNAQKYKSLLIKDPENVIIKVNKYTDRIELYNKIKKKTLESINAEDFLEMINKLDYNSGILVNKSI